MKQIYLHGLGQTPAAWERVLAFSGLGENVECPDLARLIRDREASYQNLYLAFSRFCGSSDAPVELCGLSLGGILALNYAIDHPERVHSLVLIAARCDMPRGLLRFQNALFRFMPEGMFRQTGFGKAEFLHLCKTMAELDFSAGLPQVACPTLVVCGEKDRANKAAAKDLANRLKNARLQIIPGSGHEVNVDAPETLARALRDFYPA